MAKQQRSWLGSMWDSATDTVGGVADDAYHGLTDWHFEGRDARNGETPTLDTLESDESWRLMGEKETTYHDNGQGAPERKYVRNNEEGWGGREAVIDGDTGQDMETAKYKATYNYVNPAEGGIGDTSMEGIARNLGHFALDVVPYWFGGNVRGEEDSTFLERVIGPENYGKVNGAIDGATDWIGNTASDIGTGISDGWDTATDWVGSTASDIGTGISDGWDTATDWAGSTASDIGTGISNGWDSATDWAGGAASSAGDAISSGWDSATGAVGSFLSGW